MPRKKNQASLPPRTPKGARTIDNDGIPRRTRPSDAELLERCVAGDNAAWNLLVSRYKDLVYSVALEIGLDAEDAGDVFQEVWLEVHRSAARIENPTGLPRWLMTATRRLSYKHAARRRRMIPGIALDLIDPSSLADDVVSAAESRLQIERALDELGGKCASLLRLLFFHPGAPTYEDIAAQSKLAVGSIGPIRSRCLQRLRVLLEGNER